MRWLPYRRVSIHEPDYSEQVKALLAAPEPGLDVPDPNPWPGMSASDKPVLLVPSADYHLEELVPLSDELNRRGIQTVFAVGHSPWERTRRGMEKHPDLKIHWLPTSEQVKRDVSLVVTLKDTGSMTEWVTDVRALDVPVIGKVEGAQDFWDADTPAERRPYRNLDLVLCQGQFDADALSDRETAIVGSTRLERLWLAPPVEPPAEPLALINLNFVYGVRTVDRKLWLETAIEGCDMAGIPYVISVHPAERSRLGPRMTRISASALLAHASVLISRFSTVPLEAIARGVPFIYHNPHNETVKTFAEAKGAFDITSFADELGQAVRQAVEKGVMSGRIRTTAWYLDRVSIDGSSPSQTRAARILATNFGEREPA